MAQRRDGTPAQLDLAYDGPWPVAVRLLARARRASARLCVVCGRVPAHLIVEREPGHPPARLCLRCHHGVMRQRKMARAGLGPAGSVRADDGLIVPRESGLSAAALYQRLSTSRRRAQQAARAALGAG